MIGTTRFSFSLSARLLVTAVLGIAGGSSMVRADLVVADSFSGTPGKALAGMSGGTGFSDAWHAGSMGPDSSANYVQQATSLEGGAGPSTGGRVASLAQYSLGGGISRDLASPIGTAGTSIYISMLLRADGTLNEGASGGFFGLVLNGSTTTPSLNQDLFIGKTSGNNFGIEDVGGNNSHMSNTAAAIGVSNYLVVRADFTSSGPDKFTLYTNPTAANMGDGVVKQDTDLGMISSVSIYSTGAFSLDELRIGTTLGDVLPVGAGVDVGVVPEPASVIMLGLAGLGFTIAARVRRTLVG